MGKLSGKKSDLSVNTKKAKKTASKELTVASPSQQGKKKSTPLADFATPEAVQKDTIQSKVEQAISTVFAYDDALKKQADVKDLIDDEGAKRGVTFIITFTRCKAQADKAPQIIDVPHPVYDLNDTNVCFICRDPQRHWKDRVASEDLPMIAKVIDFGKLMKRYQERKARDQLRRQYDVFMGDWKIMDLIVPFLGCAFREHPTKMPWALKFDKDDETTPIKPKVVDLLTKTRIIFTMGTRISVRIGSRSNTPKQIAENAQAVYDFVVKYMTETLNKDLAPGEPEWLISQLRVGLTDSLEVPITQNLIQRQQ